MKRIGTFVLAVLLVLTFVLFALGSGSSGEETDLGTGDVAQKDDSVGQVADCTVDIASCRLAKDWEGNPIVIVKYVFTNNKEESQSFMLAFDDQVYQDGVGLNSCYIADDSANYSSDNQTKEIKKGATLDVEAAYVLNDTTTDVEVEVSALFSFDNSKITKTFPIAD